MDRQRTLTEVYSYFSQNKADSAVEVLLDRMEEGEDVFSRKNFRGHITAGALALNKEGQYLSIFHNKLQKWLLPGGHIENEDSSLRDAALRELIEETGIDKTLIESSFEVLDLPLDIDYHPIPENKQKDEPAHYHWDCVYAFKISSMGADVSLDLSEVSSYEWRSLDELDPKLRAKLPLDI